jgi:SSS family solute:Na+ symporter/sodium/pantothenate symporter
MDRKLDLLIQMVPVFMLGLRWPGLTAGGALAGLTIGIATALIIAFGGFGFVHNGKIWGFHPGLVALIPNLLVAIVCSRFTAPRPATAQA